MDMDTVAAGRTGPFWDAIAGRVPGPPAAETLGWAIEEIDPAAGTIRVSFDARPAFRNPMGNIQGGFLAAMLDDTMGPALAAMLGEGEVAPTLNLNVSFERPAHFGTIAGKGRVLKRGRDVCFLAGELYQDGQRVASATATAIVRRVDSR